MLVLKEKTLEKLFKQNVTCIKKKKIPELFLLEMKIKPPKYYF